MDGTRQLFEQDQAYRATAFLTSSPSILGEGNRVGHCNGSLEDKIEDAAPGSKAFSKVFSSNSAILASSLHDDFLFLKLGLRTNANMIFHANDGRAASPGELCSRNSLGHYIYLRQYNRVR